MYLDVTDNKSLLSHGWDQTEKFERETIREPFK